MIASFLTVQGGPDVDLVILFELLEEGDDIPVEGVHHFHKLLGPLQSHLARPLADDLRSDGEVVVEPCLHLIQLFVFIGGSDFLGTRVDLNGERLLVRRGKPVAGFY